MANTKKTPNIVVQNINIRQTNRQSQDIEQWKNAITQFENPLNPNRVKLYDLYSSIVLDGQVEATWGKRRDSVLNKDLLFVKDGNEDPEINKLLNCSSMRSLVRDLHDSIAWGYSLLQINNIWFNEDEEQYVIDYDLIPRRHVHPERGFECVSRDQNSATKDILFKEPPLSKYMIWAGDPNDMGLLIKVAQYVIYKRGDFGDWAQFAEIFGMPFREARYDGYDEGTRIAAEKALEAMGSASYALLPKGVEFTIHDNSGSAGGTALYKDLYDCCNAEISKIILGNTLTTEQGDKGTQALGTVHQKVEDAKNAADEKFIIDILNGKLKAILKLFGFNVQGGDIWFKSSEQDWNQLMVKWNVINGIANRIPVSDDYIYEEFDIPKPDNYDQLKEELTVPALNDPIPPVNDPLNKDGKPTHLRKRILNFFV